LVEEESEMIVVGCDVGSLTTKAVALKDDAILGYELIRSRASAGQSAVDVMDKLLKRLDLTYNDIHYCVGTGYGRYVVPFANANVSEISCHGRGAHWLVPTLRTIIDVGGQDFKAIRVDDSGFVEDFRMNDKCAAGTGRSLEIMAKSLGVDISQLGPLSLKASKPVALNKPCCVMTQIEIRHLIFEGKDNADIAAGINDITARSIVFLVHTVGIKKDIGMTGGVAKHIGVVKCLERLLETTFVQFSVDPQIIGAIGAALFAADKAKKLPSLT
jgi:predicted CoA-substrate-specific enzyme activase